MHSEGPPYAFDKGGVRQMSTRYVVVVVVVKKANSVLGIIRKETENEVASLIL